MQPSSVLFEACVVCDGIDAGERQHRDDPSECDCCCGYVETIAAGVARQDDQRRSTATVSVGHPMDRESLRFIRSHCKQHPDSSTTRHHWRR